MSSKSSLVQLFMKAFRNLCRGSGREAMQRHEVLGNLLRQPDLSAEERDRSSELSACGSRMWIIGKLATSTIIVMILPSEVA